MRTVGVDTGGTFTDLVLVAGADVTVHKRPSTPGDPGAAVAAGLAHMCGDGGPRPRVVHGTTVALNALLTGRLARTAFVTNAGFADILEIGRGERADLYALEPQKPRPLAPPELCFEVPQRTWPDPHTGAPIAVRVPSAAELERLRDAVAAARPESIAIGLLHAYADPRIERRVAEALAPLGIPMTLSAELLPEHREVERFTTALVNAALLPLMERYIAGLEARLGGARLHLLRSSGGLVAAARAAREPVRIVLSGPAGGVIGATRAAADLGFGRVLTLDLGGTSTDVAFGRAGGAGDSEEGPEGFAVELPRVAGHTLLMPSLDVHTIGCGGGSLARAGAGGALEVGPDSAGADPGPACHGKGTEPTLTDAHLVLGHLTAGAFLGGAFELDHGAALRAFEGLAQRLGLRRATGPIEAARAVVETARAAMRRAAMVMSSQRGLDPAQLPLVAFGGGGGLHAAALAERLGAHRAVVPRHPGALSALGMAFADPEADAVVSVLEPLARWSAGRLKAAFDDLVRGARAELAAEGERRRLDVVRELDLRYRGQSFELRLGAGRDPASAFHGAHAKLFGYALAEREVELVALRVRVRARGPRAAAATAPRSRTAPAAAQVGVARADFGSGSVSTPRWNRDLLPAGARVNGPARIEEYSGTTLVPPGWRARVAAGGHLLLERS